MCAYLRYNPANGIVNQEAKGNLREASSGIFGEGYGMCCEQAIDKAIRALNVQAEERNGLS